MPDQPVPGGEVDFVRGADAGMPGNLVSVDFSETRADAVPFSDEQIAQGYEILKKLPRADIDTFTYQSRELARQVPKGL